MKECFKFEMEVESENKTTEDQINNIYINAGSNNAQITEENEDS